MRSIISATVHKALLALLTLAFMSALAAQEEPAAMSNFALPVAQNCSNEIGIAKPKIYIANFLVTYGKKTMGRLIADNIAFRFETDDRFELISRKTVDKEMSPLFKRNVKADEYLNLAVSLAGQHQADCVIFGKIGKKGSKISFLVRMASVATGENKVKVDQDVDRKEASTFFESTGDSLVTYFSAAPVAPVIVQEPTKEKSKGALVFWGGYNFLLTDSATQSALNAAAAISGSSSTQGGISGGVDLWFRIKEGIDIGAGIGYLSIYSYKYSTTLSGTVYGYDYDVKYIPAVAQIRFIAPVGLYAAFGAGYYTAIGTVSVTAGGVKASASGGDSSFGINAVLGWQIKLGSGAALELGVKFWHLLATGSGESFTPFAGLAIRF